MTIAIIGLGLIGGSLAKTIRKNSSSTIYGFDLSGKVLSKAQEDGVIDSVLSPTDLSKCDMVFIALYPKDVVSFIKNNQKYFKKDSVIIDCAGIKTPIVSELYECLKNSDFHFIGGHPMAGREVGGYENSDENLFVGAYFIMTPCGLSNDESLNLTTSFLKQVGFKDTTITTPKKHDQMIAYTSQLPHVLSCAYIFNPLSKQHSGFSAGSFKDVSRVALINEILWSQLFLENKDFLCEEIDTLIKDLASFKQLIEKEDRAKLEEALRTGRRIKTEID